MTNSILLSRRVMIGGAAGLLSAGAGFAQALKVATSEQALGPFFPVVRPLDQDSDLSRVNGSSKIAKGPLIDVFGQVTDRNGRPIPRVRIDLWQANAAGRYAHPGDTSNIPLDPNFQGSAVIFTDDSGHYRFRTVKPGAYDIGGGRKRTPHIHADIMGRSQRLTTQMYFPNEPLNDSDILFPSANPKESVIARAVGPLAGQPDISAFAWDIVLALA